MTIRLNKHQTDEFMTGFDTLVNIDKHDSIQSTPILGAVMIVLMCNWTLQRLVAEVVEVDIPSNVCMSQLGPR